MTEDEKLRLEVINELKEKIRKQVADHYAKTGDSDALIFLRHF